MINLRFQNKSSEGQPRERVPYRSISNYQFYTSNKLRAIQTNSALDIKMYNRVRHECISGFENVTSKRICACLYDNKGRVVAEGVNSFNKTHPLQEKFGNTEHKIFLHAEIDAVVRALRKVKDNNLDGLNLAISRVCFDGADAQAFPCDGCIDALKHYGCSTITYFDDNLGICKFKL